VEGLRTTPFFGLAPDPDAERLDSDAECRKIIGEELHSHFNYERDTLPSMTNFIIVQGEQLFIPQEPVGHVSSSVRGVFSDASAIYLLQMNVQRQAAIKNGSTISS
jgi:hypothetical protein